MKGVDGNPRVFVYVICFFLPRCFFCFAFCLPCPSYPPLCSSSPISFFLPLYLTRCVFLLYTEGNGKHEGMMKRQKERHANLPQLLFLWE